MLSTLTLTKIEKHTQKTVVNPSETTKHVDLKLKKPSFRTLPRHQNKPNITPTQQK